MNRLFALGLIVLLVGCASVDSAFQKLQTFTQADLQAALTDATNHGDQEAVACYSTLLKVLPQFQAALPGTPIGAVSGFQAGRDLVTAGTAGGNALAKQINLGCAALFVDANATILKLAAQGAALVK